MFILSIISIKSLNSERLFLVKYGESLYPADLTNRTGSTLLKLGWYFYYFEKDSFKILIDSGTIDQLQVDRFKIKNYKSPENVLLGYGISSSSITDIFITHSHFDHIEGVLRFPNAKIHIQKLEYLQFKKSSNYKKNEKFFLKKEIENSLFLLNGEASVYDFIKVIPTYGHTVGSQAIEIKSELNHFIITGDECYFVEECMKGIGTFSKALVSKKNNSIFMQKIIEFQHNSELKILTLHDPKLEKELNVIE